jgi:hypothetical protein
MRKREESVRHLIEHCKSQLAKVKEEYEASLQSKKINPALQIDVKNLMENLRSVLDYLAHDVYEKVVQPSRVSSDEKDIKDIYFPYGKEEDSFKSGVSKCLPKLDTLSPNVFLLIERVQPHKCGNNWLYDLCTILNQNKHDSLSPQEQHVTGQSYQIGPRGGSPAISAPAGAIKAPPGAIRIGNQPVIFDSNTGIPIPTPGLEVKVTTWIGFRFADTKVEVLPLLQLAVKEINQLAEDIYKVI